MGVSVSFVNREFGTGLYALQIENKSVSRILYSGCKFEIGVTIIHLAQLLPVGSSDLPGGRSPEKSGLRAGSPFDASLFGLAPRGVCLAAPVTKRAGALLH